MAYKQTRRDKLVKHGKRALNGLWLLLAAVTIYCLFFAPESFSAVTPNSPVTAQTPNRAIVQFLQGTDSAGVYKTLYSAGANGSKCLGLLSTNNDNSTHVITVQLVNGGVKYGGVAVTTVASAGFANGVPPQSFMAPSVWPGLPIDSDGNPFIMMVSGDTLAATFASSLGNSAVVNLYAPACYDY